MPRISILMPIHNCEKSIRRSLDSIHAQTFTDYELVVAFNNCTDKSEEIVRNHPVNKGRVLHITYCSEKGIVPTLNSGIKMCYGEFIARMDGDDLWYPTKLEKQVQFLEENPYVDIVGTQLRQVDGAGNPINAHLSHPLTDIEIKRKLFSGQNSIVHPSVLFRRKIFLRAGTYDDHYRFAEDYHFWLKCCRWYRFANLDEVLIDYTVWKNDEYNPAIVPLVRDIMTHLYQHIGFADD